MHAANDRREPLRNVGTYDEESQLILEALRINRKRTQHLLETLKAIVRDLNKKSP